MKKDSPKVKGGRPEAPINWAKVDEMLQAQCSGEGIAGTLGIHPDTLYRRCLKEQGLTFTEYAAAKKATGKDLLRMKQFELAMEGDRAMLIFLGKVVLGQRETQGVEIEAMPKFTGFSFLEPLAAKKEASPEEGEENKPNSLALFRMLSGEK